jgi:hypothetical protein
MQHWFGGRLVSDVAETEAFVRSSFPIPYRELTSALRAAA